MFKTKSVLVNILQSRLQVHYFSTNIAVNYERSNLVPQSQCAIQASFGNNKVLCSAFVNARRKDPGEKREHSDYIVIPSTVDVRDNGFACAQFAQNWRREENWVSPFAIDVKRRLEDIMSTFQLSNDMEVTVDGKNAAKLSEVKIDVKFRLEILSYESGSDIQTLCLKALLTCLLYGEKSSTLPYQIGNVAPGVVSGHFLRTNDSITLQPWKPPLFSHENFLAVGNGNRIRYLNGLIPVNDNENYSKSVSELQNVIVHSLKEDSAEREEFVSSLGEDSQKLLNDPRLKFISLENDIPDFQEGNLHDNHVHNESLILNSDNNVILDKNGIDVISGSLSEADGSCSVITSSGSSVLAAVSTGTMAQAAKHYSYLESDVKQKVIVFIEDVNSGLISSEIFSIQNLLRNAIEEVLSQNRKQGMVVKLDIKVLGSGDLQHTINVCLMSAQGALIDAGIQVDLTEWGITFLSLGGRRSNAGKFSTVDDLLSIPESDADYNIHREIFLCSRLPNELGYVDFSSPHSCEIGEIIPRERNIFSFDSQSDLLSSLLPKREEGNNKNQMRKMLCSLVEVESLNSKEFLKDPPFTVNKIEEETGASLDVRPSVLPSNISESEPLFFGEKPLEGLRILVTAKKQDQLDAALEMIRRKTRTIESSQVFPNATVHYISPDNSFMYVTLEESGRSCSVRLGGGSEPQRYSVGEEVGIKVTGQATTTGSLYGVIWDEIPEELGSEGNESTNLEESEKKILSSRKAGIKPLTTQKFMDKYFSD